MMVRIVFIRHGKTQGNNEKRYIGTTNESLADNGIEELENNVFQKIYPCVTTLYTSPMLRCLETAKIVYPKNNAIVIPELQETYFGEFENKNFEELKNNPQYRKWIDSNGNADYSKGESREDFTKRCIFAFDSILKVNNGETTGIVCHGGTIMTLLQYYSVTYKDFYSWQVENGNGYSVMFSTENRTMESINKLWEK